jgi:hypothetical protein
MNTKLEPTGLPIPYSEIGALCLELALGGQPPEKICAAYNIDPKLVSELLTSNAYFRNSMVEANKTIKEAGPNAGFILRAKHLAESHLKTTHDIARNPETHPSVRMKAIESLVSWARLAPTPDKNPNTGPTVTINIDPSGFAERRPAPITLDASS